jgi:hypothetical protein
MIAGEVRNVMGQDTAYRYDSKMAHIYIGSAACNSNNCLTQF